MVEITIQGGFPRSVVAGAGALLLFVVTVAGISHATNAEHVTMPPTRPVAAIDLSFRDLPSGGIAVSEAASGRPVATVAPQTGGFLRGIMRALVRGHRRAGEAPNSAFRLTRWADGRLSIEDPTTHESIELEAFGPTNEEVFARFLDKPGRT